MAYIVPRVLINQEFSQIPVFSEQPLAALIIGPQYKLFRYSEASEKPFTVVDDGEGNANEYQYDAETTYDFPNRPAGAVVDESYVKVFLEKAEAKYFPNEGLGTASDSITRLAIPGTSPTKYYSNRFQTNSLTLKSTTGYNRNSVFASRDVKPGDVVEITNGSGTTLRTKIKALHAVRNNYGGSIASPTNEAGNKATAVENYDDAPVWAGTGTTPVGDRVTVSNTSTNYDGYVELGVVADVYTVEVTTAGDLSTSRWKITSANSVFAPKTNVALDNAVLVIDDNGTNDIQLDFDSSVSFSLGDKFTLSVAAGVTQVTPSATGTFLGSRNITYRLTVVRGGAFYDGSNADSCARIAITSNDVDSSATVNVAQNTAFQLGSLGITATFATAPAAGGFILGDVYLVSVTAESAGAVQIVETYDVLPAGLLSATGSWTMSLFLVKDFEVPALRDLADQTLNWEVDVPSNSITIFDGIPAYESTLHSGGTPVALPVVAGKLFVEHRDLLKTNVNSVASLNNASDVATVLGTVHPDNPLAQAVYNAALNSNGVTVYYAAIGSNDLAGYNAALELAKKADRYYSLVPLTHDTQVIDSVIAHVNAQSTPENAKWRIAWVSRQLETEALILDANDQGESFTATVADDANVTGTKYDLVTISGAKLITTGVRAGDKLLINFRLTPAGEVVSDEYIIDDVITETTLKLATGLPSAISDAVKVQIKREFTKDEQADTFAVQAGDYNNRRVRAVFPDEASSGGIVQKGYFIAAALAGLRSGVVPHQGLTNTELLGFDDLTKAVETFSEDQLNRIAEQGVWIVTQDVVGATPYVRHQLTTDESSLNTSEDSPTTNVDSISYGLQRVINPFIGRYNRNPYTLDLIRNAIFNELLFRQTGTFTETAGNQLNGFTIVKIDVNPAFKDRIDIQIKLEVPYPYNFINITLFV